MTDAAERAREELIHDLEVLHRKRSTARRRPLWPSLRVVGLAVFLASAFGFYTGTSFGRLFGFVGFILGALLMAVPREITVATLARRLGRLPRQTAETDPGELDREIAALESALAKLDSRAER